MAHSKEVLDALVDKIPQPECDEEEKQLFYIITALFKIDKDFRMFLGLFLSVYKSTRLKGKQGFIELSKGMTALGVDVGSCTPEHAEEIYALLKVKEMIDK